MSTFNIGFQNIDFGRWLLLLTRQEFDIKAVGWVRVVSGWQSLISMYPETRGSFWRPSRKKLRAGKLRTCG